MKLNSSNIIPLNSPYRVSYFSLQDTIKNMIAGLYTNARYKIADDRAYQPITQGVANCTKELNAKAIALTLSQDSEKFNGHMLEVSMLLPSMKEIKRPLAYGDSKTILNFLECKNSISAIKKDLLEMNAEKQ